MVENILSRYRSLSDGLRRQSFCFSNGAIISESGIERRDLFVRNCQICSPFTNPDHTIDCKKQFLTAGLIDLQVNGAAGVDFSAQDLRFETVSQELLMHGVTSFLAAVVSRPFSFYKTLFENLPKDLVRCLGFHLEGPFLNKSYCGAHSAEYIVDSVGFAELLHPFVKMITLAPELQCAFSLIKECSQKGIISSCGHSEACIETLKEAKKAGLSFITHLFNCMPLFHHRNPGIIGAILGDLLLPYSLICDGVHTSPQAVRIAYHSNPEGLILTSDCNALLGASSATATLGERPISKTQNGILAGSTTGLLDCVKNMILFTGCPLHEAFCAASLRPAKLLGIDKKKGKLEPGYDADILFLSESLELQAICYR